MSYLPLLFVLTSSYCFLFSLSSLSIFFFFFFNDTATTEIYTLSLHDALPISLPRRDRGAAAQSSSEAPPRHPGAVDRKSTRLNSSHGSISYAVFCLKKKKKNNKCRKRKEKQVKPTTK